MLFPCAISRDMTALRVLFSFLGRELDPGPHTPRAPYKRPRLRPPQLRLAPVALLELLVALLAPLALLVALLALLAGITSQLYCWLVSYVP